MALLHVVEDDAAIRDSLCLALETEGFQVQASADSEAALELITSSPPALMLLDLRLPGMDGLSLCRKLRAEKHFFPIIILSARDEEIDRITGLETGADDYMVKPYNIRELSSRIRACLRRAGEYSTSAPSEQGVYRFGTIRVEALSLKVYRELPGPGAAAAAAAAAAATGARQEIILTPIEFRILLVFLENPNIILRRDAIITAVWGPAIFLEDERTVDVHIRHLREKVEENPSSPQFIQTVRGFGYKFAVPQDRPS